jgi:hypothetical protein
VYLAEALQYRPKLIFGSSRNIKLKMKSAGQRPALELDFAEQMSKD